jgi:hypothetical protein
MSLALEVGHLAWLLAECPEETESVERFREKLAAVNRLLTANGLPPHEEPETLPPHWGQGWCGLGSFPYGYLHYLRRAIAFSRQAPEEFCPLRDGEPEEDSRVQHEIRNVETSHLICHSDCEGFYVPVDFPDPLYDPGFPIPGDVLGSSHQALRELIQVAPLLGITLKDGVLSLAQAKAIDAERDGSHPYEIERQVWLTLYQVMDSSIRLRSLVIFC